MDESKVEKLPELFSGATHRIRASGEPVKITHWVKDGDHKQVERYPIERREFKGLLVVDAKTKFALRFGEWIVEDGAGRIWVESSQELPRGKYEAVGGAIQ
jgi:hypothetical protein